MKNYQNIFITGASRGIGKALALSFAEPGVNLGIGARNLELLHQVKKELEAKGATVYIYRYDVVDSALMENSIYDFLHKVKTINLVIANAGVWLPLQDTLNTTEELNTIIDINIKGVINTIRPFFETMLEQKYGQCVAMSSVAGYFGVPGGTYAASKAAVRILMDTWRVRFYKSGIVFTTLNPGNVDTDMFKDSIFNPPILMSTEQAAKLMKKAILAKKRNVVLPISWAILLPFIMAIPWKIRRKIFSNVLPKLNLKKILTEKKESGNKRKRI